MVRQEVLPMAVAGRPPYQLSSQYGIIQGILKAKEER